MSAHPAKEAISDPLRAAEPCGDARSCERLRLAGSLLFGVAALTLAAVVGLPDPAPSDRAALGALAAVCALLCALLALWRSAPRAVLIAVCPAGTVVVAAAVAVAEPVGLAPAFVVWPLSMAAYFLGPRGVVANALFALALVGGALALWAEPGARAALLCSAVGLAGASTAVVMSLRAEVRGLVGRQQLLASRDILTGALSRIAFEARAAEELERSARRGTQLALVMLGVDRLKRLNDDFGHAAGDEALRAVARVVDEERRASDVFGRLGGDEFAILVLDSDLEGASRLAERVRERMALLAGLRGWPSTLSFGVAGEGATADDLLREAGAAMYAAKRQGRDRVVRADAEREAPLLGTA